MILDINSPIPLHVQLKEFLRQQICTGQYTEQIPSEKELMETFSVSRTTVREAVSFLVREGLLEKIHGKGTFVTDVTVNEWLGTIRSFTETIENMGMKPGIRLLSHGLKDDPEIASILRLKQYYGIERLRFADDTPIAIERTNYPVAIGRKLATYDLNKVTLYSVLEENGIVLHSAEQRITAMIPSEADAKLLGISQNTCVLTVERVTYDPTGNVVEYYLSLCRADRFAFCVKLHRKNSQVVENFLQDSVTRSLANSAAGV
jgi:GntR family transcriptional regulator